VTNSKPSNTAPDNNVIFDINGADIVIGAESHDYGAIVSITMATLGGPPVEIKLHLEMAKLGSALQDLSEDITDSLKRS
jgi:hypothetical protein